MKMKNIRADVDPAAFPKFADYIAAALGTRLWCVAPRLTARHAGRHDVAISQKHYTQLENAWHQAQPPEPDYTISEARYSKGMMLVRPTSNGSGYKTRAARLIGDGLNCRYTGRENAYVASPSKVAKFERLYAAGWDASVMTGALDHREFGLRDFTVAQALKADPCHGNDETPAVEICAVVSAVNETHNPAAEISHSEAVSDELRTITLPPYPRARELAGPSKLLASDERAKLIARAEDAEFQLSDMSVQLAQALARAEAAEAAAAPAIDAATARIVALEREVQHLQPRAAHSATALRFFATGKPLLRAA